MDQVPPAPPMSAPPVVPLPGAKSKIWLWILTGVIFLGAGTTGGVFLGRQLYSVPHLQPVPTPSPIVEATLSPSADPTANWKIYTNETLSFSFSYPQELSFIYDQLKDYTEDKAPSGNLLLQNFDGSKPRQELSSDFQIAIFVSKDDQTNLEQLAQNAQSQSTSFLTIAGEKALKGTSIQKYKNVPTVWLKHSGHLFTIQFSTPQSTNTSWSNLILSTFKFLDQDNVSNLCTTDADCGVNICDCKADLNQNIPVAKKACARYCPGAPRCINNRCQLITENN